ncbi:MAG: pilus assembly protein [Gemmataceae bacterium]|nr:pilus assembly protein [Gemmataceae bacterium]
MRATCSRRTRRGATTVESALVLAVFLLLLFGMFEYCRFLLVLQVTSNAARDGARYAVVNLDKPGTFNNTDYTDGAGNTFLSVQNYTTARMGGVQQNIENFRVSVYAVDPSGLTLSPPVVRPKSLNPPTYPDPFNASDPNARPWNSAAFTEKIAVTIDGNYRPILPTLMFLPSTISVRTTAIMGSEG